jgi:hypothetical protein
MALMKTPCMFGFEQFDAGLLAGRCRGFRDDDDWRLDRDAPQRASAPSEDSVGGCAGQHTALRSRRPSL